jgi:type IV secretion system protein VirB6
MADLAVAQTLFNAVDNSLNGTISTGTSAVMAGVGALFACVWVIKKTIDSVGWWWSGFNSVIGEEALEVFKVSIIVFCAFNISWYMNTVVPFINETPTWFIQKVSGSMSGQNQVDVLINAFINGVSDFIQNATFDPLKDFYLAMASILVVICFFVGGIPFLGTCVATLVTLKIAITLFEVVGPIFIAFLVFEQTRQYFWGWVSLMGGFMLTQIIFGIAITLEINFLNGYVITPGPDSLISGSLQGAVALMLYFGAFTFLATEIPSYAATVMGGAPSSASGLKKLFMKGTGIGTAMKLRGAFKNRIKPS